MFSGKSRFFYSSLKSDSPVKQPSAPIIPITNHERIPLLCNSAIGATGVGGSIIPGTIMFFSAAEKAGGLSLFALSSLGLGALLGIGLGSLILTLATGYYAYHELLKEAKDLNQAIFTAFHKREVYYFSLFLSLLYLRLLSTKEEYQRHIQKLYLEDINPEVHELVDKINEQLETDNHVEWHRLFCNENHDEMIKALVDKLNKKNPNNRIFIDDFLADLQTCYHSHDDDIKVSYKKAIIHGMLAGVSIPLTSLGTIWLFSALVIGAGVAASIPIVGWAILGGGCLILGIALGISYGLAKHNNIKREAIHQHLDQQNEKLEKQINRVKDTHSNLIRMSFLATKPPVKRILQKNQASSFARSY